MYGFLLNMWIMKKIDEAYLARMVELGRITQEESEMIQATPQSETGTLSTPTKTV